MNGQRNISLLLFGCAVVLLLNAARADKPELSRGAKFGPATVGEQDVGQDCRVALDSDTVELRSPFFVFRLNTADGLRVERWENRLTGHKLSLGSGPEVEFDVGLPDQSLVTAKLKVIHKRAESSGATGEAVFELSSSEPATLVTVTYRWDANQPVLRKFVEIENTGGEEMNRLLNVRLGSYDTDVKVSGGEQGFPLYLNDEFFVTLAHPAGWATGQDGKISLRQYPGIKVRPGKRFTCMEIVYGVSKAGLARDCFLAHLHSRMRRVVRRHDKPYAIYETFGGAPDGKFFLKEQYILEMLDKVAQGQVSAGYQFDLVNTHFWVDYYGDLKRTDPKRFPGGLKDIHAAIEKLGARPGLWIDSSWELWSIGGNPDVQRCLNFDPQRSETLKAVPWNRPSFCRATEPIKSMYTDAFRYHIRDNGVRLLKFDNLATLCVNPNHDHLPGIYSTEPIMNAVIEFLRTLDAECPDVFLMLYWGYRSPWWLLYGDTLFDSGIGIEAASPSDLPAAYVRQSVIQKLDQAQWHAKDIPPIGKDSLGVWLSDWPWNSSIGKERWQDAFVMDICRGSLLAQIWTDADWLSPPERKQIADFIALLKTRPECFGNPRFILGDPRKDEPYGYCCSGSGRAFLALHNCCWRDSMLSLRLNSAWRIPDGLTWDLYRWYPNPAQLDGGPFGEQVSIRLRPFEVVLLEAVPCGESPSLNRKFEVQSIPVDFAEPSRPLDVAVEEMFTEPEPELTSVWTVLDPVSYSSAGGATLTKQEDGSIVAGGHNPSADTYIITADTKLTGITAILLETLTDASLPADGPGRATNGNYALTEFSVTAALQDEGAAAVPVSLKNALADFSQKSHGGWPVAAAIDGDTKTGWSVHPRENCPHAALFETEKLVGFAGGTRLTFTLQQGEHGHNIGRLRLSVTAAKPPLELPMRYGPRRLVVKGEVPATASGGILVVSVEMKRGTTPTAIANVGEHFCAQGELAGRSVQLEPVLGKATYPARWQAWRIAARPCSVPQAFELAIKTSLVPNVDLVCKGHFVPR